ncbi:DUF2796 domain-containing protein [Hyphobacterium sp.]|uniref:ZrgA family zinc uptake protein n=1 Tax=Hyphobacterium sp. TaxID=2004662 RepID=UPI00374A55E2
MSLTFFLTTALSTTGLQGDVHVHGHGSAMMAAEDNGRVEIILEIPAESLWGFERSPRTDAERQAISDARDVLGGEVFSFSARADCQLLSAEIGDDDGHESDGHHGSGHDDSGHHDVEVHYVFQCSGSAEIDEVSTTLFAHFARLEELESVFVDSSRQIGFELTEERSRYPFPR